MDHETSPSALCYVEAARLENPAGERAPLEVRGSDGERIGSLDGVVIDPVERRLRFVVVKSTASRRYLLPPECAPRFAAGGKSLRVELEPAALVECEEFEPSAIRQYSDADFLGALFRQRIA